MKLLTIIVDATGALHIEATRAPDLRRREISAQTGSADLIFAAVPPLGQSAEQLVAEFGVEIGARMPVDADTVRRIAVWRVHVKPRLQRVTRTICKRLLRKLRLRRAAPIPDPAH
ncbi:hypothetical protein NO932_02325 [Pelagibacterium sp. 26DY04]|uniref:hypothetical protein n=1 Tax=Pelagibacterium sp. 26DY04 TaxID=2967130 RepID=UPI002814B0D9|nr:hypothetical protein [Pelagibacterium sp. 26DY04]WMT87462.1 hypothetical protein NO932_02325 [Pelagibacterium sp. 26DY04]